VIIDCDGEGSRKVSKERIVQVPPRAEKTEPNDVEGDLEKEYVINKIIAADRDDKGHPIYRIRWEGYTAEDDTWEPEQSLPSSMIISFLRSKLRVTRR
jgi:Chromo (CHRromatin Organisation MOdifier) domain